MTHSTLPFSQEASFNTMMAGPISALWQQRHQSTLQGANYCQLSWVSLTPGCSDKVIVIVNGRIESYYKYQELFFDLINQGYHIYALDHRGQGMSQRLIADAEMGYVDQFDDYVTDLYRFITDIVMPQGYQHHYLLGHSMGGAISSLLLARYPTIFDRAVLSAPMHGIHLKPSLRFIAEPLARLNDHLHRQPTYAPGQRCYYPKPFVNNPLTHSEIRFQWFKDLYQQYPQIRLGGASNRWVWQSIAAARACIDEASNITTPTLVLQGSADHIVDNQAHARFCQQIPTKSRLVTITDARHELLFESDQYRNIALTEICNHFATL
ncbi:alpha/beta fold hydrolase [Photobacterium aquimaris]|uniref:Lysophospholipase L2 n=1 Tax=Photobacterium aquimaris TaxID=512643 RepID=A0A1Y6KZB9_9GAMM|nr:alpha/beta fold hydrolase [Photobacterium aquimaris]SMY17523.1 lysophospholipase L2 [Photobacterium aquimaris]